MVFKIEIIRDTHLGSFIDAVRKLIENQWYIINCVIISENNIPIYFAFLKRETGSYISGGITPEFNVISTSDILEFKKELEEDLNSGWKRINFTAASYKRGTKYIAFLKKN